MSNDIIVLFGRNQYRFPTTERAAEARDWIAARGNLANPAEFAANFADAELLPGLLGSSSFPG